MRTPPKPPSQPSVVHRMQRGVRYAVCDKTYHLYSHGIVCSYRRYCRHRGRKPCTLLLPSAGLPLCSRGLGGMDGGLALDHARGDTHGAFRPVAWQASVWRNTEPNLWISWSRPDLHRLSCSLLCTSGLCGSRSSRRGRSWTVGISLRDALPQASDSAFGPNLSFLRTSTR